MLTSIVDNTVRITVSVSPVILFLLVLRFLDSYKLVRFRPLLVSIAIGALVALACLGIFAVVDGRWQIDTRNYQRFTAPILEEVLKALYVFYLIARKKLGFMVDAAIHGFAVGAGFAIFENVYFVKALGETSDLTWIIRGFGTAIMHGGASAVVAMISKNLYDRGNNKHVGKFVPGLVIAIVFHSAFNHFIVDPVVSTMLLLTVLPAIIIGVFYQSEKATRRWLGVKFDTDQELLDMINSGRVAETKVGQYLQSIRDRFAPAVVVDMLCYLRIHVELAISAKGILLMREAGFDPQPEPGIKDRFKELKFLQKSIGKTGVLSMHPFLHTSTHDLWQLHALKK